MKRAVITLALLLACAAAATAGEEPHGEVEYYRQLAEKQLAEMQADPEPDPVPAYIRREHEQANFFAVIPQYFHSRDREDDSRANGAGARAVYSRMLGDCFTFSLLYEYAFMKFRENSRIGDDTPNERERWRSHTVGVGGEFALGAFGRIIPSLAHSFEHFDAEYAEDRDAGVTSLMTWWEKDIAFGGNWFLTPYAGWRSLHTDNDDGRDWTHFAAGGLKLRWQSACLGVNLRAGLSRRLGSGDEEARFAYGARALANGVVQYSRGANKDGTVGSVGAGVTYAVGANASLGLDYDGFFGRDTSAHTGTLSFGFAF